MKKDLHAFANVDFWRIDQMIKVIKQITEMSEKEKDIFKHLIDNNKI